MIEYPAGSRGRVLLADDDQFMLRLTELMLRRLGFQVVCAVDGAEAVRLFAEEQPDLVFLDINMPVMDGYQASTRIRIAAGPRWVPIVFLTGASEEEALGRCVEAGGDDFLSKPVSSEQLNAKLIALDRIRVLHDRVREQNQLLEFQRLELIGEQESARSLFERLAPSGSGEASNIRQYRSVATVFSGDILLSAWSPSGIQSVLLGDFTGHGLPAALCAIPLTDVFHSQVARNATAEDLIRHIDARMRSVLPDHMFLALVLATYDPVVSRLLVWNGGLPAPILWRRGRGVVCEFPSRFLPLGISGTGSPNGPSEEFQCEPDDRLFLFSDGLIEARSAAGEMFGTDRVRGILVASNGSDTVLTELAGGMDTFRGSEPLEDDVTMVELRCEPADPPAGDSVVAAEGLILSSAIELSAESLRGFDPVSWAQSILAGIDCEGQPLEPVLVIIAELYANALDHGVLAQQSDLKQSPEGFAQYYRERESALASLTEGRIAIELSCRHQGPGWLLSLRVADSGRGFDYGALIARPAAGNASYCGRGIAVVKGICDRLAYFGCGNTVLAECSWQPEPVGTRVETTHHALQEVV